MIASGCVRLIERRRRWLRALGAILDLTPRKQPDRDLHLGRIQLAQPILTNPDIALLSSSGHYSNLPPTRYIIL
jgi:hypothetical protein